MEEENKIVAEEEVASEPTVSEEETNETRGNEPHGSVSASRPGDRKYGNHKGRPSERRGGRGGFRKNTDDLQERVVAINRISKTVQGGKHMRFSALVVVGDGNGKYGFALSKSGEVPDAIKKALAKARKNMVSIEIGKNGTIAHEVVGVYGSTKVVMKPARPGTGIVAGGPVRAVAELAGVAEVAQSLHQHQAGLDSGDVGVAVELGGADTGDDAVIVASGHIGGGPSGHVGEGVSAAGLQTQQVAHHDGHLITGDHLVRVEVALVVTGHDTDHFQDLDGFQIVLGIHVLVARGAGADDHHAQQHDRGQSQRQSPFQVSHTENLLIIFEFK